MLNLPVATMRTSSCGPADGNLQPEEIGSLCPDDFSAPRSTGPPWELGASPGPLILPASHNRGPGVYTRANLERVHAHSLRF